MASINDYVFHDRRALWSQALRSGDYRQGRNKLKTRSSGFSFREDLRRENFEWCCLGVACDVFARDLSIISTDEGKDFSFSIGTDSSKLTLPDPLRKYLGLSPEDQQVLVVLNDAGVPFDTIAAAITYMSVTTD